VLIFASIRRALVRWGFNTKQRADPPADVAEVLAWVARNSASVSALAEPATARRVLDQATDRVDGKPAAASTARRHRIILANAMDYAVELGLLDTNPIRVLKWTAPKVSGQGPPRTVRHGSWRAPLRRRSGRRAAHHYLPARMGESPPGGPDRSRASVAARSAAL